MDKLKGEDRARQLDAFGKSSANDRVHIQQPAAQCKQRDKHDRDATREGHGGGTSLTGCHSPKPVADPAPLMHKVPQRPAKQLDDREPSAHSNLSRQVFGDGGACVR